MKQKQRVAITGIGIVSPLANDKEATWQALMNQKSGIDKITHFNAEAFTTKIAAEVKNFDIHDYVNDKKLLKNSVSSIDFALAAAEQAFDDASIRPDNQTASRWACVVGAGMMTSDYEYWDRFNKKYVSEGKVDKVAIGEHDPEFFQLSDFGKTIPNTGLDLLLARYGIKGFSTSVHTACASGGQSLGLALQTIRRGDADYVLTGGFDSMIKPFGVSSFCLLGALSTKNESPTEASSPFDLNRNGFVLGEGAAFLILEKWEHAEKRGAKIYAELAGEGNSLSSYRITDSHPSGDGAIQAIEGALRDANVDVNAIDYINAHGTSTKMNDLSETNAIKHVFKERAKIIPTSSTKSQTGHLIAAAGAIEGALCAMAINKSKAPMTANLKTPDPECDLDYITEGPRELPIRAALSNSFGFGGSNSCLIFKNPNFEGGQ